MNPPAAPRVLTIDVAKGIGILLVVIGHNPVFRVEAHSLYEAVYLFHMPLFFFLSGVTFRIASPLEALKKRARALLVPYFVMGAAAVVVAVQYGDAEAVLSEVGGVLYGTGHTIRFVPVWFLPCLFLVSMTATLTLGYARAMLPAERFERWRPRLMAGLAALGFVCGALILGSGTFAQPPFTDVKGRPIGLPWSLDLVPFALAIFLLGAVLSRSRVARDCPMPIAVVVAAGAVLAILVSHGTSLDLNYRRMSDPFAVAAAMAAGIVWVLALSSLISRFVLASRVFSYIGSASLIILMLHSPLQRRVIHPFLTHDVGATATVLLTVAITVALICALDFWVIRRVRALGWVVYPRRDAAKAA
jgi:fucose 4-O-acetylase-like acetyltransferase